MGKGLDNVEEKSVVPFSDVLMEAIKSIKNEILLYAIVIAILLVSSGFHDIELLKELKWPLVGILTIGLVFYLFAIVVPKEKKRMNKRIQDWNDKDIKISESRGTVIIEGSTVKAENIVGEYNDRRRK